MRRGREALDAALDHLAKRSAVIATLPTPAGGPPLGEDREVAELAARAAERVLKRRAVAVSDESGKARRLEPADIGIAATHRAMNSAVQRALRPELRRQVRVDTPERWQGLERKLMIIVHPLSAVVRPSAFDLETGRLCVMASRHRAGLIVISRDHVLATLEMHIPSAAQAVGRPDVTGRGHLQHWKFWHRIARDGRVVQCA